MLHIKFKNQQGVSIYLAVLISSVILSIALGIATVLFSQARITSEIGDSVLALYAADTGVERILYDIKEGLFDPNDPVTCPVFPCTGPSDVLSNGAGYSTRIQSSSPLQIRTLGSYPSTNPKIKRAIEINY